MYKDLRYIMAWVVHVSIWIPVVVIGSPLIWLYLFVAYNEWKDFKFYYKMLFEPPTR